MVRIEIYKPGVKIRYNGMMYATPSSFYVNKEDVNLFITTLETVYSLSKNEYKAIRNTRPPASKPKSPKQKKGPKKLEPKNKVSKKPTPKPKKEKEKKDKTKAAK